MKPPELDPRFRGGARLPYPDQHIDGARIAIAITIVCAWCIGLTMILAAVTP